MESLQNGFDSYEQNTSFMQKYYQKNRESILNYQRTVDRENRRRREKKYREQDPQKRRVRLIVFKALRSGKLKKGPCEVCGSTCVQAHHDDYSRPLVVRWLCRRHHADLHIELRRKTA